VGRSTLSSFPSERFQCRAARLGGVSQAFLVQPLTLPTARCRIGRDRVRRRTISAESSYRLSTISWLSRPNSSGRIFRRARQNAAALGRSPNEPNCLNSRFNRLGIDIFHPVINTTTSRANGNFRRRVNAVSSLRNSRASSPPSSNDRTLLTDGVPLFSFSLTYPLLFACLPLVERNVHHFRLVSGWATSPVLTGHRSIHRPVLPFLPALSAKSMTVPSVMGEAGWG
jgi:hypothetical protein